MAKTFSSITELNPRTVMVVDSLNLAFRWKHSGDLNFLESYIRTVDSLRKSYGAGKVVMTCDSGSSSYRKAIYPEYKQNRKDKHALQTPEEQKEFELFFEEFNRVMESYEESTNFPVFRFDKTEADDIAALIVKNKKHYEIDQIWLISSDRDWNLLVDDGVSQFSYVTRKEFTVDNWAEHYEFTREEYISIKCLQGDSGDNVLGVPGVGPKKALALVREYGTAYDIAANLPIASKYKYIQNLNAFGTENLMLNYKLMDLLEFCDEAIGPENCKKVNHVLEKYLNGIAN